MTKNVLQVMINGITLDPSRFLLLLLFSFNLFFVVVSVLFFVLFCFVLFCFVFLFFVFRFLIKRSERNSG